MYAGNTIGDSNDAMTTLQIHYTTFNLGRLPVDTTYFASSLCTTLKPTLPPDLIVLSLQEVAPIGYAFLGGSLLTPYFTQLQKAVNLATQWTFQRDNSEIQYDHILTRNVGMTGIMLFARTHVKEQIEWIEQAGTGIGVWQMGNKGAVGVRLGLRNQQESQEETTVTFVAAHLAPMEEAYKQRNDDWIDICQTLVFQRLSESGVERASQPERQPLLSPSSSPSDAEEHTLFNPPGHIFFAGDLNYRTQDTKPSPSDFETWPQPMSETSTDLTVLLEKDQLTRELRAGRTLHHLAEAPIQFPPTYKYSSRAQKLAEETAQAQAAKANSTEFPGMRLDDIQEQVWLWAKHRAPSWCDRVLYLASAPPRTIHNYTALPVQPTSDHRPVTLSCEIPWGPLASNQIVRQPRYDIIPGWQDRRAAARRLEFVVGVGAYLGFTSQGEILLAGTVLGLVGGYLALSYLVRYS